MPGSLNEIKLVNNAMSNATRRKIMNFLAEGDRNIEEIGGAVGKTMLDFHLKLLQQASLIEIEDGNVKLSEYGRNFLKGKEDSSKEKSSDPSQAKPIDIVEVRQLMPCIADSSKFRVIANIAPSLGGTLKVLEPLFPRGRYSDKIGALIIQKGEVITTIYGTGKVTLTMIKARVRQKRRLTTYGVPLMRLLQRVLLLLQGRRSGLNPWRSTNIYPRQIVANAESRAVILSL